MLIKERMAQRHPSTRTRDTRVCESRDGDHDFLPRCQIKSKRLRTPYGSPAPSVACRFLVDSAQWRAPSVFWHQRRTMAPCSFQTGYSRSHVHGWLTVCGPINGCSGTDMSLENHSQLA